MAKAQKCRASGRNGAGDSSCSNAENSSTTTSGGSTNTGSSASCKELSEVKRARKRKTAPRDSPLQRSSAYRGVTRHRWTGRYEAHLWDKDWCNAPQKKKGRQVYLGAYDDEEAAARAYDLAALKYWGRDTALNFPLSAYQAQLKEMDGLSREVYVGSLRRKSSGFSRGVSKYRGVARHHHNGRWEARIGRVFGNKYLYLGTYATQEEAATAYDMAAIEYRGLNAVTNFDISRYGKYLRPSSADNPNPQSSHGGSNSDHPSTVLPVDAPPLNLHQHQEVAGRASPRAPASACDSPSALGLLLHSSKLKQMLERASMAEGPPTPPESSDGRPPSARCSFPEDVQTYFECQDGGGGDVDDFVFGGLDSFVSSVFQWELDS